MSSATCNGIEHANLFNIHFHLNFRKESPEFNPNPLQDDHYSSDYAQFLSCNKNEVQVYWKI